MVEITIVIATYNASATLRNCLDSIVGQLTNESELIIVDGASKDDTNAIISSYGNKVAVHVSEPDKGIYDAWNKGIKLSHGKWIMFVGADDILLPGALKSYLDLIHKTKGIDTYDYICAHNEYVDMDNNLLKIIGEEPMWNRMRKSMVAAHVASLHNKQNLFETVGGYNLNFKICADYELLLRKKQNLKYLFIPAHIAQMKVGGMSFSTKAVVEAYKIKKLHRSLPLGINELVFLFNWTAYKLFILRKSLMGMKVN